MATTTKNTLPSFAQGTYNNIVRLINDGGVNAPAFIYFSDKECLGFLDSKKVLHTILWDRVEAIEDRLEDLVDPDTGESVNVVTYVTDQINPVSSAVENIQNNGATILLTSDGGDN